ncbi:hypothetical protein HK099_007838 [Clydaea vesicula]|uniref:Uncharacterized protein n=1 Tax=Clydaea vesicula TaxID=447962 RepID=A0AAD5UBQ5_9FUNG|nr:hypothetical protein HK099_007838 [Clydaea vesicula]KAJ3396661.1 hypothetical protein HDU92_002287 [Lobulomyces angularis]
MGTEFFEATPLRITILCLNGLSILFSLYMVITYRINNLSERSALLIFRYTSSITIFIAQLFYLPRQILSYHNIVAFDETYRVVFTISDFIAPLCYNFSLCLVLLAALYRYERIQMILPYTKAKYYLIALKLFTIFLTLAAIISGSIPNLNRTIVVIFKALFPLWVICVEYSLNIVMIINTLSNISDLPESFINNSMQLPVQKGNEVTKLRLQFFFVIGILIFVDLNLLTSYLLGSFVLKNLNPELSHLVAHLSLFHVYTSFRLLELYSKGIKKTKQKIKLASKGVVVTELSQVSIPHSAIEDGDEAS